MVSKIFFIFTPIWGRFPFLTNIFQMGWFNHQRVMTSRGVVKTAERISFISWISGTLCLALFVGMALLWSMDGICQLLHAPWAWEFGIAGSCILPRLLGWSPCMQQIYPDNLGSFFSGVKWVNVDMHTIDFFQVLWVSISFKRFSEVVDSSGRFSQS